MFHCHHILWCDHISSRIAGSRLLNAWHLNTSDIILFTQITRCTDFSPPDISPPDISPPDFSPPDLSPHIVAYIFWVIIISCKIVLQRVIARLLNINSLFQLIAQLCRAPHERYSSAIVLPKRLVNQNCLSSYFFTNQILLSYRLMFSSSSS